MVKNEMERINIMTGERVVIKSVREGQDEASGIIVTTASESR